MIREIGGYMEIEHFTGEELYKDLHKFNLARTALVWLLEKLGCRKIFVPFYNCDSVANSVSAAGIDVSFYSLDERLQPVFEPDFSLEDREWIYIINYYGQLDEDEIKRYKKQYDRIIVDNAQAFFMSPVDNIPTIYSCRKFLGVCDGAYLASDIPKDTDLPRDISMDRIGYLFGRLEKGARDFYREMLDQSDKFADAEAKQMSLLTENILRGIDYESVRLKRLENYRTLKKALPSDNPFTVKEPVGPFAYPYYHEDGVGLRKALAEKNIFVPTNWSYLLKTMDSNSLEYQWSANVVPLPVDQRYGEEEMLYMAEMIKRYK